MLLPIQRGITYGPVRSRRLGRSLGINVLPAGRKVCTFDCRYCQYGWMEAPPGAATTGASDFPTVEGVLDAVAGTLAALPEPPDYLTFSGNGEPTLHPRFRELACGIVDLRDRFAPGARTAVLSNSSRIADRQVQDGLARLDVRIMKLDAGTEVGFRRFNGPRADSTLAAVVEGLRALPGVTLQTLFAAGPAGNLAPAELDSWVERVATIRPRAVQLYTLDRGAPCDLIAAATRGQLEAIRDRLATLDVEAAVF